ncbi:hypothetical protein ACFL1U_00585 [Patescibacteria group bacterium]
MAKDNTETNQNEINLGKEISGWEAPEFMEMQRGRNWFIIFGLIAAFLIALMIFLGYYVAAIAFFIGAVVWLVLAQRKPQVIPFSIHEYGIQVGDNKHFYKDIEKFWVLYDPPSLKKLNFQMKKKLATVMSIELADEDPSKIRDILKEYLHEDMDMDEDTTDTIARILRF